MAVNYYIPYTHISLSTFPAKAVSSCKTSFIIFPHLFHVFFFFVSSYPAPLSGVLKNKNNPLLINLSFFFSSAAPLLDLIFVSPHFLCFLCHISFLKYPWFMSLPDAMCYLSYFYIAVSFNTFPTSVFVHMIFSKRQWFASITVKIQLNARIIWLRNGWISRHCLPLGSMSQYSGKSPYSTICHINGTLLFHSMLVFVVH